MPSTRPCRAFAAAIGLIALLLFMSPGLRAQDDSTVTLAETLQQRGDFEQLLALVELAGLTDSLTGAEPCTLFAPTDAAFERLPEATRTSLSTEANRAQLRELLLYHVVEGRWTLADIGARARIPSLQGGDLGLRMLGEDRYAIDVANLTETDMACSNGVLHVVDDVLVPDGVDLISDAELFGSGVHEYEIDGGHSSVLFRVLHMEVGATWGWFGDFQGKLSVNAEEPAKSSVVVALDVRSINTRNADRDGYLQTESFFHTAEHPVATFRSTAVELREDGSLDVTGELMLRGVTKELSFVAHKTGEGRFGPGTYKVGYEAELGFKRSDFGMTFGIPGVAGDEVQITVALEADRPLERTSDG